MMLPKQGKFGFKLKNLMKKISDIKIRLKKLKILIIELSERLSGLIDKIF